MSRRIFVRVRRGAMDNTPVCIFPWEVPIIQLVHQQEVTEVSIEEMATVKEGVIKVERQKLKKLAQLRQRAAPDLKAQLELMAWVDPELDPANDPEGEYSRLVGKYGMDKEMPVPVVTRIYGEFSSGAFTAKLKDFADDSQPLPQVIKTMVADMEAEAAAEIAEAGVVAVEPAPAGVRARRKAA